VIKAEATLRRVEAGPPAPPELLEATYSAVLDALGDKGKTEAAERVALRKSRSAGLLAGSNAG